MAGGMNAAITRSRFSNYLPDRVAAANADTALAWSGDADTYFDDLGTDAVLFWEEHGARLEYLIQGMVRARMRAGDTIEAATLYAWSQLTKPAKVCAKFADGSMRATAVAFPTGTPLKVWAVSVADEAAFNALVAAETATQGAILAALMAAQPQAEG